MFVRLILLVPVLLLAGCASNPNRPASIYQGECRVFADPGFVVRGRTTRDQRWIATTQETGIQVCGWRRPAAEAEPVVSCSTVKEIVAAFGGNVVAAEAYAVSQGATPEALAHARACMQQPTVVPARGRVLRQASVRTVEPVEVQAPVVKKRTWRDRLRFWRRNKD